MNSQVLLIHPDCTVDHVGYLPMIFQPDDPRPAVEQADDRYAHGGGWHKIEGFTFDPATTAIDYPEDPTFKAIAAMYLPKSEETILVYSHALVCIVRKDGSFEVGRMD